MPLSDDQQSHAESFLDLLQSFLFTEDENTGTLVMKIIMDWHKHFKTFLESKVSMFIDFVRDLYENMAVSIQEHFPNPPPSVKTPNKKASSEPIKAIRSFKVLAEAPIDIVILFQVHRKWMTDHIGIILPSVVKVQLWCIGILVQLSIFPCL